MDGNHNQIGKEGILSLLTQKGKRKGGKKKSEMITNKISVQYLKTGEYENIDYWYSSL